MANDTMLTVVGNLTADPEAREAGGATVANFTVASTPRTFDRQANEWRDGDALFVRCSAWRDMAENIASSLTKGMRVVVTGKLKQRSYETKEGEKRTVFEIEVEDIGPSLKYAKAQVTRTERQGGGQRQFPPQQAHQPSNHFGAATRDSAPGWATPGQDQHGYTEPPF